MVATSGLEGTLGKVVGRLVWFSLIYFIQNHKHLPCETRVRKLEKPLIILEWLCVN